MVQFRLTNAKLPKKEATAREAARIALADWYGECYRRADKTTPHLQIDANLEAVKSIPGWLLPSAGFDPIARLLPDRRPILPRRPLVP